MTDEGLSMNDQLVYLYRKSINSTLMFTSDLSCEQSLSYLREDPYRMSITYYFKRKDKSWDSSNIFSRTFYGYSGAVVPLEQENNEKPKFHIENTDYELQCLIKGVAYGGG